MEWIREIRLPQNAAQSLGCPEFKGSAAVYNIYDGCKTLLPNIKI